MKKCGNISSKKTAASSKDTSSEAATGKKKANISSKKANVSSDEDRSNSPAGSQNGDRNVADDVDDDDDVQWQTDTSLEAARQHIQEQLSAASAEMVMLSTTEAEKEEKTTPTANGSKAVTAAAAAAADAKTTPEQNSYETLISEIKSRLSKSSTPSQLQSFLSSAAGTPQDIMSAIFKALFGGLGKGFAKEVGEKKNYPSAAVQDKGSQMLLLRAVESFCGKASGDAVKEVAIAFKVLYDADLLVEEVIVQCGALEEMARATALQSGRV